MSTEVTVNDLKIRIYDINLQIESLTAERNEYNRVVIEAIKQHRQQQQQQQQQEAVAGPEKEEKEEKKEKSKGA